MHAGERSRPDSETPLSRRQAAERLLRSTVSIGLAATLPPGCAEIAGRQATDARALRQRQPDAIARENSRPGTREWLLSNTRIDPATKYRCPWIEGYCSRTSVRAGESISFHVSTRPASPFRIDVYRLGYYGGDGGRQVHALGSFQGKEQPDPEVGGNRRRECSWEACATLKIPADWLSGVYVGKLTAEREGLQSYVIFIVRDDRPADFIFQCSDTTWQAYNRWPSQFSLYDDGAKRWYWGPNVEVSFDRPYGKYCQIVDAPLSTGSGEWFLWEFPFAYWLESSGFDVTYISNLDTHRDPNGLRRAHGFLSVGHDEYYTLEMFHQLKGAIRDGLSVGFFSGNTCCGLIDFHDASSGAPDRVIERVDRFGPHDPEQVKFFPNMGLMDYKAPNESELVGARSTPPITGGADWICSLPDHWLYEGTGMKMGDRIPGLIGWEWHGDPAAIPGLQVVATGTTTNGTTEGTYTATVYPGPKKNFVFNASTCWWADGLAEPPGYVRPAVYTEPRGVDPRVEALTRNVLERMRG